MKVVEANALSLTFQTADGPIHALKDVTLTSNKGDFVPFLATSGCGQTTFLRCVAALEHPTGGTSGPGSDRWPHPSSMAMVSSQAF